MTKLGHFIAPLFCENDKLSLGRIAFWLVFFMASFLWFTIPKGQDIPASMTQMLYITATYNLVKKGVDTWGSKGSPPTINSLNPQSMSQQVVKTQSVQTTQTVREDNIAPRI